MENLKPSNILQKLLFRGNNFVNLNQIKTGTEPHAEYCLQIYSVFHKNSFTKKKTNSIQNPKNKHSKTNPQNFFNTVRDIVKYSSKL